MPAAGRWFITPHAVRRYCERVPGARMLRYEEALADLVRLSAAAHFVRVDRGLELWRGPKPHRLRLRVARCTANGALPQLVTVLRGCDAGWQR